jgi:hypothetical protein|tara:strand:+ start:814 stop:1089 length:276 start_codon:yes stop_codon:yes gene_type:complete
MQFQSQNEETVIDYYEVHNAKRETIKNARLRIVTFLGKTISRSPINVFDMAEEIDVLLEKNYAVTINTKRPSQYLLGVTAQKVAQSRTSFY